MKKERNNTGDMTTIKLVIDTKESKVLFAEASKDFVDLLFYWLSLPIGTVTKLLKSEYMVGSIGNLYTSFEYLDERYLQQNMQKNALLNPMTVKAPPLITGSSIIPSLKFYTCQDSNCKSGITNLCSGAFCPGCFGEMNQEITFVAGSGVVNGEDSKGNVEEVVSYMISDDLTVTPMSTTSIISMMSNFNVSKSEERNVTITRKKALELLEFSFQSTTVLTDEFLGTKSKAQDVEELSAQFAEEMEEQREELRSLEWLKEDKITRWLTSNKVLHNVRKELMEGFRTLPDATNVGVKWMGKIDPMPFKVAYAKKGLERFDHFGSVCQWESSLLSRNWYPFKMIPKEGKQEEMQQVINEDDRRLKELRSDWGEDVYNAVVKGLTEMNVYNPSGRYAIEEVWNFKEGRKASLNEAIQCLCDHLKTPQSSKRSRSTLSFYQSSFLV